MTWGFPSPSAFAGFVHALYRQLHAKLDLSFDGVGIVCHEFEPQVSKPPGRHHQVFHLTRNPLGGDEEVAAIVEEGRLHFTASLLIGVSGAGLYGGVPLPTIAECVYEAALGLRLAGGSILQSTSMLENWEQPDLHLWPGTAEESRKLNKRLARRLLPGFALVSREAILERHWRSMIEANPSATMLDALLDLSGLNIELSNINLPADPGNALQVATGVPTQKVEWEVRRHGGWLVPIPAGFNAISELYPPGTVRNARDQSVPFRFVEGMYTVGEWLSPLRVDDLRRILWYHEADPVAGVYRWTTPHFAKLANREGN
jgi:CRISPR-associated protein Csy2